MIQLPFDQMIFDDLSGESALNEFAIKSFDERNKIESSIASSFVENPSESTKKSIDFLFYGDAPNVYDSCDEMDSDYSSSIDFDFELLYLFIDECAELLDGVELTAPTCGQLESPQTLETEMLISAPQNDTNQEETLQKTEIEDDANVFFNMNVNKQSVSNSNICESWLYATSEPGIELESVDTEFDEIESESETEAESESDTIPMHIQNLTADDLSMNFIGKKHSRSTLHRSNTIRNNLCNFKGFGAGLRALRSKDQ